MTDFMLMEDTDEARAMIERMAPTLSHAGRRAAFSIARMAKGAMLGDDQTVVYAIPVYLNDELVGYTYLNIEADPDGEIFVTSRFEHLEDSGAAEDDEDDPTTDEDDDEEIEGERRISPANKIWVKLNDMSTDEITVICSPDGTKESAIPTTTWTSWEKA